MALVTRSTSAGMDTVSAQKASTLSGNLEAGEALDIAAPCYIKSSDGKIYMSNGTAANEAAEIAGWTPKAYAIGQTVTLYKDGVRFKYGSSLTPGDFLYLGATAGRLDSAATTGGTSPIAQVIDTTDIMTLPGFGDSAALAAEIADGAVTAAKLASDAVTTIKILDLNVTTGKLAANAVTEGKIEANSLTGLVVENVADANVIGGIPVVHRIAIADAATGDVDVVLTHKTLIIDVHAVKTGALGGAANTVQVKNGATAITDALDLNVADEVVVRAGTISDASHEIAAAGTLRITRTKAGGNAACIVYVTGLRVA